MITKYKNNEVTPITVSTVHTDSNTIGKYTVVTLENNGNSMTWDFETNTLVQKIISLNNFEKKEQFYLIAIENLLRNNNFLELYQELLNDSITEEEFDMELNKHNEKYVIKLEKEYSVEDLEIISDIVQKIKVELKNFSVNDVSQLFSIKSNKLSY